MRILLAFVLLCSGLFAESPFAGTWEGMMNDQPALKLTIRDTDGKLSGTMVFYFQKRGEDGKWKVVENGDAAGEILDPHMDGKLFIFELKHHKQHGGTEYGPNKKYSVALSGDKEARLKEVGAADTGQGLKLTKK